MKPRHWFILGFGKVFGILPYAVLKAIESPPTNLPVWVIIFSAYEAIPALLLSTIVFPKGVSSSFGASAFVPLAVTLNVLFYCFVAWTATRIYARMRGTDEADTATMLGL